jgi:threonine synthase
MTALGLRCVNCGAEYDLGLAYHCVKCRFPLEVVYEAPQPGDLAEAADRPGIWRYRSYLPDIAEGDQISLGEGNTPLLHAKRLGEALGLPNLYVKNEGQNPTGSFKDRPTAVGVSMARKLGLDTVAVSSTGNAGAALAAYAAQAGLRALIFVTEQAPRAKLTQMALHGARIVPVRGSLSDAFWLAYKASVEWKWMNLTSTFLCPYTVEGDKTAAYEIYRQLGRAPDWIVIPVSVGPLLVGMWNGFRELQGQGLVERLPRMVAAQAAGCAPIARAFAAGQEAVAPWESATATVAGGIADPLTGYENDGTYALRVVRKSGGLATASSDDEILAATRALAREEGVFAEPTGAVGLAALSQVMRSPEFDPEDTVVCALTGHGLKAVRTFEGEVELPRAVEANLPALAESLGYNPGR